MQAGWDEMGLKKMQNEEKLFKGYQFVYVWQSKFQSIPLCIIDAPAPSVQTCSLLSEEGVYETKTDFEVVIIGRGGGAAGFALM
jgi:hypothetical protein